MKPRPSTTIVDGEELKASIGAGQTYRGVAIDRLRKSLECKGE